MRVCTPITIRYGETDMMGVVYHANYLLYFEDARTHFLEEIGIPYHRIEEAGYLSPVVNFTVNYGVPLRYGDTALIRTRIVSSRPTKTVYAYEVFREGMDLEHDKPLADGYSTHCLVDATTFKPVSVKRVMPELYARYAEVLEPEHDDEQTANSDNRSAEDGNNNLSGSEGHIGSDSHNSSGEGR